MTIFFDMDGTIVDLYSVPDWLLKLRNNDTSPYEEAMSLLRLNNAARLLNALQKNGVRIGIITWLSKNSNPAYDKAIRRAKRRWLARHLGSVDWDEIHMVKYGTPKTKFRKAANDILFDDVEEIREKWGERAYSPEEIFSVLRELMKCEC